jgi:carboxymethylenebutenolidase
MCDEQTEQDIDQYQERGGKLDRRDFGKFSAAIGLMAMLPKLANAMDVTESEVNVTTPDGVADSYFVHPSTGKHPAILIWPDILGLRPAFRVMAKRLAESGYSVLVVNPFYRVAKAPVAPEGATFRDPAIRELVLPMARQLNQTTSFTDAKAFIAFLDQQSSVDVGRKVGTAGYCMGGPLIMRTAAAVPERVGAAASFHGGGLVTDQPDSPHLLIPKTKAQVLHAVAVNDDEKAPETKTVLAKAYADAGLPAEIEVYKDTLHGWCPPDSAVYNEVQAERAWSRLLALYERALA